MRPVDLPLPVSWPQRAVFLSRGAWILAVATLLGLGLAVLFALATTWLLAALLVCLGGFLSVPWTLARGRSVRSAGLLLLASAAALIVVGAQLLGGAASPLLVLLASLPVVGFVLLDSRAAWWTAVWISALIGALLLLGAGGSGNSSPPWAMAAWVVVTCLAIAVAIGLYNRGLARLTHQQYIRATRDHLTGLVNRRRFDEVLEEECRRGTRSHLPLGLILLDIDHFKSFNDTYGHPRGDLCLIAVSYAISTCMRRAGDLAARYGGEEFVVLVPEATESQALEVAEGIRDALRQMRIPHEGSPTGVLTVSVGVAVGAEAGELEPERLLAEVDRALYRAKQEGRDRAVAASTLA